MHERGPFTIKQNKFVGEEKVIKQPVLIFDKELGFVYAYGDKKDSDFIASYNRKKELVKTLNKDMYESMTLIDMFDYKLRKDDTCTLLNYLLCTNGIESVTKLYDLTYNELEGVCKDLQKYGY